MMFIIMKFSNEKLMMLWLQFMVIKIIMSMFLYFISFPLFVFLLSQKDGVDGSYYCIVELTLPHAGL